jgi:hypothetical protein
MVQAGREAARVLLAEGGPDLVQRETAPQAHLVVTLPPPREQPTASR